MKAGLLARVSTEEQLEGYSIDAQLQAMRKFCLERGWEIVVEWEDAHTATTDKRPKLKDALRACERREIDVLVVHKLDRAFRNLFDQLQGLARFAEWGVSFVSVVEQIDYSTPHGRLFMSMLGALNQYFSDNLGQEVKKGKRERAKEGLTNACHSPHGYTLVEGKQVVVPEEAEVVLYLFQRYATGLYSDGKLAKEMNQQGYTPPRIEYWQRATVRGVLTNRFYVGEVQYKGEWHPGQHEPIIPRELFDRVQEIRSKRKMGKTRTQNPSGNIFLLQGISYCARCGEPLWVNNGQWRTYYLCSSARKGTSCGGKYVRADRLHEQIGAMMMQLQLPDDWKEQVGEYANHVEERSDVETRRKNVQGRMNKIRDLYEWGHIPATEYRAKYNALQQELSTLHVPELPGIIKAGEHLETLSLVWEDATDEERKALLYHAIEKVVVDTVTGEIVEIVPKTHFVPLFKLGRKHG